MTQQQIAEHWPKLRELIKDRFRSETIECPSYTNNVLTHALMNINDFQICLHFFEDNLNVPCSFFILDMHYDSLIEKKICSIPLWIALRMMNKKEVHILAEELIAWIRGNGCQGIRAIGIDKELMRKEYTILAKLGLIKNAKPIYGWVSDI